MKTKLLLTLLMGVMLASCHTDDVRPIGNKENSMLPMPIGDEKSEKKPLPWPYIDTEDSPEAEK